MPTNVTTHGVAINWGVGATTSTAFGTFALIQNANVDDTHEELFIKNQYGVDAGYVSFNQGKNASFEYIVSDSATPGSGSVITKPTIASIISVTGATASSGLNGSIWIVNSVSEKSTNTDVVKVSVNLTSRSLITS